MEKLDDDQIRIALKELVENLRSRISQSLAEPESRIASDPEINAGATDQQLQKLRDEIEQAKEKMSARLQQMIDFIDRR